MVGINTNNAANFSLGYDGQIPICATGGNFVTGNITSTDATITVTNGPNTIDLAVVGSTDPIMTDLTKLVLYSDFTEGIADEIFTQSGTSTSDSTRDHPGVIELDGESWVKSNDLAFVVDGGAMTFEAIGRIDNNSQSNDSEVEIGFFTSSVGVTDGVYFEYLDGTDSYWKAVTEDTSTATRTDTGIAIDELWHSFKIEINAAGTSCVFKIDGTTVATNTTNIPTSTVLPASCQNDQGDSSFLVDAILVTKIFDGDRA